MHGVIPPYIRCKPIIIFCLNSGVWQIVSLGRDVRHETPTAKMYGPHAVEQVLAAHGGGGFSNEMANELNKQVEEQRKREFELEKMGIGQH